MPEDEDGLFRYDSLLAIFLSTLIWSVLYQLLLLALPHKNNEYCIRIITLVHGAISSFVGINQCFLIDNPFEHPEWKTNRTQKFLLVTSLGYFIHDLGWVLWYQREQRLMMVHHTYSCFAIYRMLLKGYSGAQATCALGSMELTNPFLQARWFIRSEGMYPSVVYSVVELVFVTIFFLVRILLGTYFLYVITFQPKNDWDFRVLALVIYVLSWTFMYNIMQYMRHKYRFKVMPPSRSASEGLNQHASNNTITNSRKP